MPFSPVHAVAVAIVPTVLELLDYDAHTGLMLIRQRLPQAPLPEVLQPLDKWGALHPGDRRIRDVHHVQAFPLRTSAPLDQQGPDDWHYFVGLLEYVAYLESPPSTSSPHRGGNGRNSNK
jgi:hypothetical protein